MLDQEKEEERFEVAWGKLHPLSSLARVREKTISAARRYSWRMWLARAALDGAQRVGEPVAWRVRVASDDPEEWTLLPAGGGADYVGRKGYEVQPLYAAPPPPAAEEVKAAKLDSAGSPYVGPGPVKPATRADVKVRPLVWMDYHRYSTATSELGRYEAYNDEWWIGNVRHAVVANRAAAKAAAQADYERRILSALASPPQPYDIAAACRRAADLGAYEMKKRFIAALSTWLGARRRDEFISPEDVDGLIGDLRIAPLPDALDLQSGEGE